MKRMIASLIALSVVAAPAVAATTNPAQAPAKGKVTKQLKKSKVAANAKDSKAPVKKDTKGKKNG
jgi:Ni/Co efflux regulator RcnB